MKLLCSQKVFHSSLNFSFMEISIFLFGFIPTCSKVRLENYNLFWNRVLAIPTCSVKPVWIQEDGTAKSTIADSTFMPWSHFQSQNVNFSACMTPKYFMVYTMDIKI